MKNIIPTLAILISIMSNSFSQEIDYGNSQEAADLCVSLKANSFSSNYDADEALDKILAVVGAAKRFMLVPCDNTNNAFAYTSPETGLRYIIYDEEFMNSLSSNEDRYWINMFILAHEVGHHINGHTLSGDLSQYESRLEELEADVFAGFVVAKLGADIDVIKNAFNEISFDGDDTYSTHPNKTRRMEAVRKGFDRAMSDTGFTQKKSTADEYLYSGIENYENEKYSEAIDDYTKALSLRKDYITYYNRGLAKYYQTDYPGAKSDFYRSLELEPDYINALEMYANTEYELHTTSSYYSALSYFDRLTDLIDEDYEEVVDIAYKMGDTYRRLEIYDYAYDWLKYADDLAVNNANASDYQKALNKVRLGDVYIQLDSLDLGQRSIENAVKLSNEYYISYLAGYVYREHLNKHEKAIEYYSKSIAEYDQYQYTHFERAFSYAELAKTTKNKNYYYQAISDITNAITIEPYGELYYYRGNYRNSLGINGACEDWLKAIDLEYKADETIEKLVSNCGYEESDFYGNEDWYSLGLEKYDEDEYEAAIDYFNKSILLPGVDAYDFEYRGKSYYELGLENGDSKNFELALTDFNKAIELNESSYYYFNKCLVLYALGRYDESNSLWQEIKEDFSDDYLYKEENKKEFDTAYINEYQKDLYYLVDFQDNLLSLEDNTEQQVLDLYELYFDAFFSTASEIQNANIYYLLKLTYSIIELETDEFKNIVRLNKIINAFPDSLYTRFVFRSRGDIKIEIGDKTGACEDYNAAKSLNPDYQELKDYLDEKIQEHCN